MDSQTLIIGAAGAIGKQLVRALVDQNGRHSVVCALHRSPLPESLAADVISEFGVDIRVASTLQDVFAKHPRIGCVWNLAAPLSVETAKDPELAHQVTVQGMENLLLAMQVAGVRKLCFTDSIGSFGAESPRELVPGRWLVSNPEQDPGSDYGQQKRACRNLLRTFTTEHQFDTRWCIVPGVLHMDDTWGAGTTEYALDALLCASTNKHFKCPIPVDVKLPMILIGDLIRALLLLMDAPEADLHEPEHGYAIAGFSFTALELFVEIEKRFPNFTYDADEPEPNATIFAQLWPDSLSGAEAKSDMKFQSAYSMQQTISKILDAHAQRLSQAQRARL
jgi:nucleoside-diphosphate-sugar epimerase